MNKEIFYLYGIIAFFIVQRLSELWINQSNEKILIDELGAVEKDPFDSLRMKVFHSFWFFALLIETAFHGKMPSANVALICFVALILCQFVRFHTITTLGVFWTIKVYQMKKRPIVRDGIYKYLLHPNYFAVVLEFIFLPLLLNAYFTLFIFSILNLYILSKRIKLEEEELLKFDNYKIMHQNQKRFIPFIY